MGKYVYKGNFDPRDNTEKITGVGADGDEDLLLGGEARGVSDEQYALLSTRYNLQPEGASSEQEAAASGPEAPTAEEKTETASTETTNDPSATSSGARPKGRQS